MQPKYLYKILSLRQWQATERQKSVLLPAEDATAIHLLDTDQVQAVVAQEWSTTPQYVILKLAVNALIGDLEQTPSFYRLHRGHIPMESILESHIFYREPLVSDVKQRRIVQIGDPVLRQVARELSKEEILSSQIQNLIEEMKHTMRAAPGVGLAAPQIGIPLQIAVLEDMEHSHLTAEQLKERAREKVAFHVIINPKITSNEEEIAEFFEGCLSVPHFLAIVPRAKSVRVECLNERAEPIVIHARGWYARILQHEVDHLFGTLFIDRAHKRTLMTEENYMKMWKNRSPQEVMRCL